MNPKRRTARSRAGLEATNALEIGLKARQEKNRVCAKRLTYFETHKITHYPLEMVRR
jgi:hypothetical protein